jgi:hypothetical protein
MAPGRRDQRHAGASLLLVEVKRAGVGVPGARELPSAGHDGGEIEAAGGNEGRGSSLGAILALIS